MRCLLIGNFGTGWDSSICDEEHIAQALESLGHEVVRQQREDSNLVTGGTINTGQGDDVDFILIAQYDRYPDNMVSDLKKTFQVPIIYWAFDYQADGQAWHERLVEQADLYLSKRVADSKYPNWQWFSQDFAPQFLSEHYQSVKKDIDVLFTGSYLSWATERTATLQAIDEKFNLHVYSVTPSEWVQTGLKNVHGAIMDRDLPELIARAKVNLSIDHTIEAGYWSDRNAQIMACGGFVLSRYVPMMESRFHSHIAYFFGVEDCLETVGYWLEHNEDREMIAAEGYEYSPIYKAKEKAADLLNIVRNIL